MSRIYLFIVVITIAFVACTDESCFEPLKAPVRMDSFSRVYEKPISFNDIVIQVGNDTLQLKNISFGGVGAPNDSLINKEASGVKRLEAPLHVLKDTTDFFLRYKFSEEVILADTIRLIHDNKENFISVYCGCMVFHQIKKVEYTRHLLDSIAYINQTVTNAEEVHLQLVY